MEMKSSRVLVIVAGLFVALNIADVLTTWLGIINGKAVEANPFILAMGGPFSPLALTVKLIVFPGILLTSVWYLAHRLKQSTIAIFAILPNTIGLAAITAHNLAIAIAGKKPKIVKRRRGEI